MNEIKPKSNPLGLPSHEDVINMVKEEGKIRLSNEYIHKCDEVASEVNGWLRITDEMQRDLVTQHGFTGPAFDIALNMLRNAQVLYPDNPYVKDLVYVKNNKANKGRFNKGDKLEDVTLWNMKGDTQISLFDMLKHDKPNIILAASHT
jgi:hypothetical protein